MDRFPAFRRENALLSKHVRLLSTLSSQLSQRGAFDFGVFEQELACGDSGTDFQTAQQNLHRSFANPSMPFWDKLRLASLFFLRFESQITSELGAQLRSSLRAAAASVQESHLASVIDTLLKYAGASQRHSDIYNTQSGFFAKAAKALSSSPSSPESDNALMQHRPWIADMVSTLLQGKLKASAYPYVDSTLQTPSQQSSQRKPRIVFVHVIGGCTLSEYQALQQLAASQPEPTTIIVGGSFIHNSHTFLHLVNESSMHTVDIRL